MGRGDTQVRCRNCGAKNDDDIGRCRICGSVTDAASAFSSAGPRPETLTSARPFDPAAPKQPVVADRPPVRRAGVLVVAIAVVIIAAGVGVAYFLVRDDGKSSTAPPPAASTFELPTTSVLTRPTVADGWIEFSDPDGYYAIQLPVVPEKTVLPHPFPNRPPIVGWKAEDVRVARGSIDASLIFDGRRGIDGLAAEAGGTVQSVVDSVDRNGHASADFVIALDDGSTINGYYVVADQEYFVIEVTGLPGLADGAARLARVKDGFTILR